ncbi:MAG: 50S ribosomal protein L6 [Dehalococcoidales bacterium]|nr:50S ribosomal protein L6 [Dehalococcoidales bacterium]
MSRIGRLPITLPSGVKVDIKDNEVTVTGPKGELKQIIHPDIKVTMENDKLLVNRPSDHREHRALHGLTRSLLANMVTGVTNGFQKDLEVVGVGNRATIAGKNIVLRVGYSHQVEVTPMAGVTLGVEGTNRIRVSGTDKQIVGQMAAKIRGIKPLDNFKGKGIKYAGEVVHLKAGKTGKAIGAK